MNKPYILDEQVGYLLRLASQRHVALFQKLGPETLTATQFAAVVRLGQLGPLSQNRLGRETAMDGATIKGVVERLSKKGLVDVSPDTDDKRRTSIALTDTAQSMLADLHNLGHQISEATLSGLDQDTRDMLIELLRKMS
jgi:DNA-binding MarR family transcriptional regulator